MQRVTLDTSVLDDTRLAIIEAGVQGLPVELARVSVSDREQPSFRRARAVPDVQVPETAIWDESD
jgi:hypothetical protein